MPRRLPPAADAAAELPQTARVLRKFRVVFNAVKAHFKHVEKKAGIGGAQLWALSLVRESPGIGITELARGMDVHQSTASNLVRSLVERGLVTMSKRGADRRTVQLRVSAAGSRVLSRAPGPFAGLLPEALAALDRKTLTHLERDLATLIAVLGADPRRQTQPLGD